jgi:hypothetical protein
MIAVNTLPPVRDDEGRLDLTDDVGDVPPRLVGIGDFAVAIRGELHLGA